MPPRVGRSEESPVDVEDAAKRLDELLESGWKLAELARQTGVARMTLQRIYYHRCLYVNRFTYERLCTVPIRRPLPGTLVSAIPTQRRLQALHYEGWTWTMIDRARGVCDNSRARRILDTDRVTLRLEDEVRALFDRVSGTPVPVDAYTNAARNRARRLHWCPALAWDDIDDVNERPTGWARRQRKPARRAS